MSALVDVIGNGQRLVTEPRARPQHDPIGRFLGHVHRIRRRRNRVEDSFPLFRVVDLDADLGQRDEHRAIVPIDGAQRARFA